MLEPAQLVESSDLLPTAPPAPELPPLKLRSGHGLEGQVLHPVWPAPAEPGIVESLRRICESRLPPTGANRVLLGRTGAIGARSCAQQGQSK